MPIPSLTNSGLLPPFLGPDGATPERSPYVATMTEFASSFGWSADRRKLIQGLLDYRTLFYNDDYINGIQFVDGSFVEDCETIRGRSPGDIDVFTIVSAPQKYQSNLSLWMRAGFPYWTDELIARKKNRERFSLDTIGVIWDDLLPDSAIGTVIYWYSLFSHQKNTFAWKGFITLPLSPAEDARLTTQWSSVDANQA